MAQLLIDRLCIIGVGLIGGSLARALKKTGAVKHVIGVGRDQAHLAQAKALGVVDEISTDIAEAVTDADIIVLATPLGAMAEVLAQIKGNLKQGAIISDVGSAKQNVLSAVQYVFNEKLDNFIPAHPIAGTEKGGVEASFAELFEQRRVILTPHTNCNQQALATIKEMWQQCGAEVIEMQPQHHDEVLAATSHLPHMLAYALVDTLARMDDSQEIFEYAAGGFRDFTRIASSDPLMWHDICIANQEELVKVLRAFNDDLHRLSEAVEKGDSEFLKTTFMRAKNARDKFCG